MNNPDDFQFIARATLARIVTVDANFIRFYFQFETDLMLPKVYCWRHERFTIQAVDDLRTRVHETLYNNKSEPAAPVEPLEWDSIMDWIYFVARGSLVRIVKIEPSIVPVYVYILFYFEFENDFSHAPTTYRWYIEQFSPSALDDFRTRQYRKIFGKAGTLHLEG
jgi:hypothetical protein